MDSLILGNTVGVTGRFRRKGEEPDTIVIGAEDADFGIQFGLGGGARFVTVGRFYEERIQIFYRYLPGGGKNGKNRFFAELLLCFREETFFNIGIGKNKVSKFFIRHAGVGDEPIFTDGIEDGILQGGHRNSSHC